MPDWFPQQKQELARMLDNFLSKTSSLKVNIKDKAIHGLIVPHAGYVYSGDIAGKAFSLLKNKNPTIKKAIIFGPSHYKAFRGIASLENIQTPLGKVNITKNTLPKIQHEHSVENQIPFLQKINPDIEILPIAVGQINMQEAQTLAKQFLEKHEGTLFVFSTDLSHFLNYNEAKEKDLTTIDIITNLEESKIKDIDACGIYPLLILLQMCKIKSYKPHLIEYKNSGDIIGDKSSVVGYASFYF